MTGRGGSNPFHGSRVDGDGVVFSVWAPHVESLELHVVRPHDRFHTMKRTDDGFHVARIGGLGAGTAYLYRFPDGRERPDPASQFQPEGVHAASVVVSHDYAWSAREWRGLPLDDYVLYELHVGTFSREGTFDGVIPHLDRLAELGITAIEIMPASPFPGERNWGYDGVYPHAVHVGYGGPEGLKRLVDACHRRGLALVLDVVYNHLGPEGNYIGEFAPYFTDRYKTAWGLALNFDGPGSDHVRRYFIESALRWIEEYRIDGLRLDAVHAIVDTTATPFLAQVTSTLHARANEIGRDVVLIAESDLNDPRIIRSEERGGFGYDAQWADDLHHALHAVLTGEQSGYYADYGALQDVATIFEQGWLYTGQYSTYRDRSYGAPTEGLSGSKFIVCLQNHDQIGNRMHGDRLAAKLSFGELKVALGLILASPFTPMLFMGEEYGEKRPFLYFTSHTDENLAEAVRKGRAEEFAAFAWEGEVPDPGAPETFLESKLALDSLEESRSVVLQSFVRELLRLRRELPPLQSRDLSRVHAAADEQTRVLVVRRRDAGSDEVVIVANFSASPQAVPKLEGRWRKLFDSSDPRFLGHSDAPSESEDFGFRLPAHTLCFYGRERQT